MTLRAFKLPLKIDLEALEADLAGLTPEDWVPHFNAREYEGDWSGAALRSVGGVEGRLYPDPAAISPFADTKLLSRCPGVRSVLEALACRLESVRFLKLGPGSRIREHRDLNLGAENGTVRLHVPITVHPRVEFYLDDRRIVMNAGECWYLDFNLPHRVFNGGDTDRVHLVIDCLVDARLRTLIPFDREDEWDRNATATAERGEDRPGAPGESPRAAFERFRSLVLGDPGLQSRLMGTPGRTVFLDLVVRLGHERGLEFAEADVDDALRAARRAWLERWI